MISIGLDPANFVVCVDSFFALRMFLLHNNGSIERCIKNQEILSKSDIASWQGLNCTGKSQV